MPFGGGALDRRGGGAANGSGALFDCIGAGAGAGAVASRPANMFSESAAGASRPRRLGSDREIGGDPSRFGSARGAGGDASPRPSRFVSRGGGGGGGGGRAGGGAGAGSGAGVQS